MAFEEVFGQVQMNGQVGIVRVDDRYTLESGSGTEEYIDSPGSLKSTKNESRFSELRGTVPVGDFHAITTGVSYSRDKSDTNDYDIPYYRNYRGQGPSTFYSGGKSKTWALFCQDEWKVTDPLTLYLGLRYDSWKVYEGRSGEPGSEARYAGKKKSEFTPRVAGVWDAFDGTTFRASVGHAFRPPTLYELYRTWQSWGRTYQSNPDLKPETVWTYEMGVDKYFWDGRAQLSLTGYRNDIEDLIYYRTEGTTKTRSNAGKARTYGLELEATHELTGWLTLRGNLTYTDAKITENPTDRASEGKQVAGIPKTAWNLAIDTRFKMIKGSVEGRYYSKIYNDSDNMDTQEGVYGTYEPAFLMDADFTITPLDWMDISFSVNNIMDDKFYEYYVLDGRTYYAGLTMRY